MAVLVTRPAPENEITAAALRARGFEVVLAPLLVFQPLSFRHADDVDYRGVILTSASAIRAIAEQPILSRLQALPLFAVGSTTALAARAAGFVNVRAAEGDAGALRDLITANVRATKDTALLYLCAADVSRDLKGELGLRGIEVVAVPVYRMAPLDEFPASVLDAFAQTAIQAVLHYSRRSALAFIGAARRAGLEISALALPQVCLSEQIAVTLRDAGAARVVVAKAPNEAELFDALEQALRIS